MLSIGNVAVICTLHVDVLQSNYIPHRFFFCIEKRYMDMKIIYESEYEMYNVDKAYLRSVTLQLEFFDCACAYL